MTNTEKSKNDCTNQDNPNNHAFWQAKGYDKRPKNWKELSKNLPQSNRARKKEYEDELNLPSDAHFTFWYKDDY